MKSRRFSLAVVFALVLSLVFAFGLSPLMKPSTAAPAPADNESFKGKIVMAMLEDRHTVPLEHAQTRKLGDRCFLVGKGIDDETPGNWTKGRMTWVPMNRVCMIVEFENVEGVKKAWEEMRKAWDEYQKNAPALPPKQAGQAGSP